MLQKMISGSCASHIPKIAVVTQLWVPVLLHSIWREKIVTRCRTPALPQTNNRPLFRKTLLNKFSYGFTIAKWFF